MTTKKSLPVGETEPPSNRVLACSCHRASGTGSPNAAFLTEADIIHQIETSDTSFQVWRNGYERGLAEGAGRQALDDEALADFAARIAISRVENHSDTRATIRSAVKMIDVLAARKARANAAARSSMREHGAP